MGTLEKEKIQSILESIKNSSDKIAKTVRRIKTKEEREIDSFRKNLKILYANESHGL